jgi:hypothetical protein
MLSSVIRSAIGLAIVLQLGACSPTRKANVLDGCYFLGEEPILEVQGTQGKLLVPGDIAQFRLVPQGSSDYVWMTTRPNFVIGGSGRRYVKSVENSASPSPVIIIETESLAPARFLVHDNGEVTRLVYRNSCPTEPEFTQPTRSAATSGRTAG